MKNGIDVSKHNGTIDWGTVKVTGKVDFAILRAGYGKLASQKDVQFERNYDECKKYGIPVGAYWYSYAITPAEAEAEARAFLQVIQDKQFEYPVWFDIEERKAFNTGMKNCSAMIRAFCSVMEQAGYWCGVYCSTSAIKAYIDADTQKRYAMWVAEWGNNLNYNGDAAIWQYSEKGRITGIHGNVDLDRAYVDYPELIKAAGKNGYEKPIETPAVKPVETLTETSAKNTVQVTVNINGKAYSGILTEITS